MIEQLEVRGPLILDSTSAGERRADGVFPAHPNGTPASRRRWLIVYATRGFEFVDDDRSILYQIRDGAPDGRLIKEGLLSKAAAGWRPFGDDRTYFKQHGHPVAFGVPKGAVIDGRPAPHANVFVVKWRVIGVVGSGRQRASDPATQGVEWIQVRLNDREDDIEIVQPPAPLRPPARGWTSMNQTFVQAVPFNRAATEWADVNHFDGGRIAALKYRFGSQSGRYECVAIGPFAGGGEQGLFEASLVSHHHGWIIAARKAFANREPGVAWIHTDDPFAAMPEPVCPLVPPSYAPVTMFRCADGVVRLFTGDPTVVEPPRGGRNPLFCWDIDPDRGFAASHRRVVFDTYSAGLPLRPECGPVVDMCKLLPHTGGNQQYLAWRVRPKAITYPANTKTVANAVEKQAAGIFHAVITYDRADPGPWTFGGPPFSS